MYMANVIHLHYGDNNITEFPQDILKALCDTVPQADLTIQRIVCWNIFLDLFSFYRAIFYYVTDPLYVKTKFFMYDTLHILGINI